MEKETITLKARCLCKANTFTSAIPKSSLPLRASACHCTSCRHATGSLCYVVVPWPNKHEDISNLKQYSFSKKIENFACATCSTPLFCRDTEDGSGLEVVTGALDNDVGVVDYGRHIFVGNTNDGGCSLWLKSKAGGNVKRWEENEDNSQELPSSWPELNTSQQSATSEPTPLWCHCKGVELQVKPASTITEQKGSTSNFSTIRDGKYLAELDACNSCRLSLGTDLVYWAFIPISQVGFYNKTFNNISELEQAVESNSQNTGTLATYSSSEKVTRYHCSRCSASIFYTVTDRPEQIDVAVGVLDSDGARAEGLLKWDYTLISYMEDTHGGWREEFVKKALEEMKQLADG